MLNFAPISSIAFSIKFFRSGMRKCLLRFGLMLAGCVLFAQLLSAQPGPERILPSGESDTLAPGAILLSPGAERLFFTLRDHPANIGIDDQEDIWMASRDTLQNRWSRGIHLGAGINTTQQEFPMGTNFTGQVLYLLRHFPDSSTQIWCARLQGRAWAAPRRVRIQGLSSLGPIESWHISSDEQLILFTAKSQNGDLDIYQAERITDTRYGHPSLLPAPLNSAANEKDPWIAANGHSVYLLSDRGAGGYWSVYLSQRKGNQWTSPALVFQPATDSQELRNPFLSEPDERLYYQVEGKLVGRPLADSLLPQSAFYLRGTVNGFTPDSLIVNTGLWSQDTVAEIQERRLLPGSFFQVAGPREGSLHLYGKRRGSFSPSFLLDLSGGSVEELDEEPEDFVSSLRSGETYRARFEEIQRLQQQMIASDSSALRLGQQRSDQALVLQRVLRLDSLSPPESALSPLRGPSITYEQERRLRAMGLLGGDPEVTTRSDKTSNVGFTTILAEAWTQSRSESRANSLEKLVEELLPELLEKLEQSDPLQRDILIGYRDRIQAWYRAQALPMVQAMLPDGDDILPSRAEWRVRYRDQVSDSLRSVATAQQRRRLREPLRRFLDLSLRMLLQQQVSYNLQRRIDVLANRQVETERSLDLDVNALLNARRSETTATIVDQALSLQQNITLYVIPASLDIPLQGIVFVPNSVRYHPGSEADLQRIVSTLAQNPELKATVTVHTNTACTNLFANFITSRRAGIIKQYLLETGLDPGRIEVLGRGKRQPLSLENTDAAQRSNQRVEVRFERISSPEMEE